MNGNIHFYYSLTQFDSNLGIANHLRQVYKYITNKKII